MTDSDSRTLETWTCGDCEYTERAPVDELAGQTHTKTVGHGRQETTIETAVCPECQSDDWFSESIRAAFGC